MKGVIVCCLRELVKIKFGSNKWEKALAESGAADLLLLPISDIDDHTVIKIIDSLCKILNISFDQAADAFGDYWVNEYAPKMYAAYLGEIHTAKQYLLKMDEVHVAATKNIPNAKPPRFEYTMVDDHTLIMKYKSHRGLIKILMGLIKGVGKHFNENLVLTKLGEDRVKIVFP